MKHSIITSTGSYIPDLAVPNSHFMGHRFFGSDGRPIKKANAEIIEKLNEITGIRERRYAPDKMNTSDIAWLAAENALGGVDRESLDYIIVAQNFGDVKPGSTRADMVPNVAARVKHKLKISNPYTVALDLPFGCPGWLQGTIMADCFIKSGDARRVLVIGAEILSRVSDPHDVDSMIFADGAGATLVEATDQPAGILAHVTRSDTLDHAYLLRLGSSYDPGRNPDDLFIKMDGHAIYRYAVKTVPLAIKEGLDRTGLHLRDVSKVLLHQANEKMDHAMLNRLFKLYGMERIPDGIMPMMIGWTGNSSVATLPTLFDRVQKGKIDGQRFDPGDLIVFASVGAGMNINALVYRMPR